MQTTIVIGSQDDAQSQALGQLADYFFCWNDRSWDFIFNSTGAAIVAPRISPTLLQVNETVTLFLRPAENTARAGLDRLMLKLIPGQIYNGFSHDIADYCNKLTGLKRFGEISPQTLIRNRIVDLDQPETWIIKGVSQVKTQADTMANMQMSEQLSHPYQMQERCRGTEYKFHILKDRDSYHYLAVRIAKKHDGIDCRFENDGQSYFSEKSVPLPIKLVLQSMQKELAANIFDVDVMIHEGEFTILEWNDSPESAFFEYASDSDFPFTRGIMHAMRHYRGEPCI